MISTGHLCDEPDHLPPVAIAKSSQLQGAGWRAAICQPFDKQTDEVDRFCDVTGFERIGHMPDVGCDPPFAPEEKDPFRDGTRMRTFWLAAREYLRLANALLTGTKEELNPRNPCPTAKSF